MAVDVQMTQSSVPGGCLETQGKQTGWLSVISKLAQRRSSDGGNKGEVKEVRDNFGVRMPWARVLRKEGHVEWWSV